jgi:IMP dehydrogenase
MLENSKIKFAFDDLLIVPWYSALGSRNEVDVFSPRKLGRWGHGLPIISAAMDTVTDITMMKTLSNYGALGIHHRYNLTPETVKEAVEYGALAVSPSDLEENSRLYANLPKSLLVIDVAHGDSQKCHDLVEVLKYQGHAIVSGNITTVEAADFYMKLGVTILRVGVGGGSVCSTRVVAGVGYPQASAIYEIKKEFPEATILSDGGVKSSGDIVKALALGADYVITGRLLAGTRETPGEVQYDDSPVYGGKYIKIGINYPDKQELDRVDKSGEFGGYYKAYRGMASRESLEEAGKTVRPEGVSGTVPYRGPVLPVLNELIDGIKAGCAYVGARNIGELREKAEFIRVTQAGYQEGLPRI